MGTSNFAFNNRCIVVRNEDFEDENVPKHNEYLKDSLRNHPSYLLDDYDSMFKYWNIVLTSGYYEAACIDYIENDCSIAEDIMCTDCFESVKECVDELYSCIKEPSITMSYLRKLFKGFKSFNGSLWEFLDYKISKLDDKLKELERSKVEKALDELKEKWGFEEYGICAKFSNGETWYSKVG